MLNRENNIIDDSVKSTFTDKIYDLGNYRGLFECVVEREKKYVWNGGTAEPTEKLNEVFHFESI